jgi:hypothetical protein
MPHIVNLSAEPRGGCRYCRNRGEPLMKTRGQIEAGALKVTQRGAEKRKQFPVSRFDARV